MRGNLKPMRDTRYLLAVVPRTGVAAAMSRVQLLVVTGLSGVPLPLAARCAGAWVDPGSAILVVVAAAAAAVVVVVDVVGTQLTLEEALHSLSPGPRGC